MTTDGAFHSLAKCMAKSKLLTAVTLALMIAPFFYYAWPKALLIAACVQVGSILFRSLFMRRKRFGSSSAHRRPSHRCRRRRIPVTVDASDPLALCEALGVDPYERRSILENFLRDESSSPTRISPKPKLAPKRKRASIFPPLVRRPKL